MSTPNKLGPVPVPNRAEDRIRENLQSVLASVPEVPASELPRLLGQLREIEAAATARLCAPATASNSEAEQLIGITEAAKRLDVSEDWLYRNWKIMPFAHKYEWGLRFSARDLATYIRQKGVYTAPKRQGGKR